MFFHKSENKSFQNSKAITKILSLIKLKAAIMCNGNFHIKIDEVFQHHNA